jgi:hypothetical protein
MAHKSATTKLSERTNDFYPTPDFATEELLKRVHIDGKIAECCVGDGRMAEVLRRHLDRLATRELALSARRIGQVDRALFTNDLSKKFKADFHLDASDERAWSEQFPRVDWVVTNPPYNQAHAILPVAYKFAKVGIAFLLRLSYLEPAHNRFKFLIENKPHGLIVTPRISFKVNKTVHPPSEKYPEGRTVISRTDNMTTVWCVWYKQRGMNQFIDFIAPLEKPASNGHDRRHRKAAGNTARPKKTFQDWIQGNE